MRNNNYMKKSLLVCCFVMAAALSGCGGQNIEQNGNENAEGIQNEEVSDAVDEKPGETDGDVSECRIDIEESFDGAMFSEYKDHLKII